jgi:hypothetical protein
VRYKEPAVGRPGAYRYSSPGRKSLLARVQETERNRKKDSSEASSGGSSQSEQILASPPEIPTASLLYDYFK